MDNAKSQLIDKLKTANSVLITVSKDPSVDQLAACIGLTLLVNKLDKHGSAVFSGKIPSTIEFLKPEETIEKNADSLRDFIIALDKAKADKLRYKVEDQMVKIFITPYRTSLSEDDFDFSQGDFNVELIIAIGVEKQEDLDQAIVAHGRILHDATVAVINTSAQSNLGTISWREPTASSLCELVTDLAEGVDEKAIDEQIATALLTGIIAETNRFSNEKTSPQTMSVSAKLMAAGANQQLVASNLNGGSHKSDQEEPDEGSSESSDGTLSIKHGEDDLDMSKLPAPSDLSEEPEPLPEQDQAPEQNIVEDTQVSSVLPQIGSTSSSPRLVTQPPALGGTLTANSAPEQYDPSTDPLSNVATPATSIPSLDKSAKTTIQPTGSVAQPPVVPPAPSPVAPPPPTTFTPPPPTWTAPPAPEPPQQIPPPSPIEDTSDKTPAQTLNEIEQAVNSPHLSNQTVNDARQQVQDVLNTMPDNKPPEAENALPLGQPLHEEPNPNANSQPASKPVNNTTGLDPSLFSEVPPAPPPFPYPNNFGNTDQNAPK